MSDQEPPVPNQESPLSNPVTPPGRSVDWKFWWSVILAVGGIGISLIVWRIEDKQSSLLFRVISDTALEDVVSTGIADVKIVVGGKELKDPHILVFELANNGGKPVRASDFEGPLNIVFGDGVSLARVSISETYPEDLKPRIMIEGSYLRLNPLLLNPGDSILFEAVTANRRPLPIVEGRIAELSSIDTILPDDMVTYTTPKSTLTLYAITAVIGIVSCFILIGLLPQKVWPISVDLLPQLLLGIMFVICSWSLLRSYSDLYKEQRFIFTAYTLIVSIGISDLLTRVLKKLINSQKAR